MALTDEQRARDSLYAEVFADRPAVRGILDDMQQAISGMPIEHQAGAWRLYGYIQLRASAIRRSLARAPKGKTKT